MSTYTIGEVTFEYDEMDLTNLELYQSELERLQASTFRIDIDKVDAPAALAFIREQCEAVLDFFDCVVGEGTSEKLFKGHMNIRQILSAFNAFQSAVTANLSALKDDMTALAPDQPTTPMNREQKRAAEREQRRKEAAARAAAAKDDVKKAAAKKPKADAKQE